LPVIDVINGPNLNLLGTREPKVYGTDTLDDINNKIGALAKQLDVEVRFFQSNHEGEIIDRLHESGRDADFIIINAGAYTHTSIAIRDALAGIDTPAIEVHLSNPEARETFRRGSYIAAAAVGKITGLGYHGYLLALRFAVDYLKNISEVESS